jgi:hypothetical protein
MRIQISIIPNIQQTLRLKKHERFLQDKSYNSPLYIQSEKLKDTTWGT